MADNNTSAFNDRKITGGSAISIHAYGLAIDINPVQNPFVKRVSTAQSNTLQNLFAARSQSAVNVSPKSGSEYLDRKNIRPGMAEGMIDIFADNGFLIWGGRWSNPTDYQHFQVSRGIAEELARLEPEAVAQLFETTIKQYHECLSRPDAQANHRLCVSGSPYAHHSRDRTER